MRFMAGTVVAVVVGVRHVREDARSDDGVSETDFACACRA